MTTEQKKSGKSWFKKLWPRKKDAITPIFIDTSVSPTHKGKSPSIPTMVTGMPISALEHSANVPAERAEQLHDTPGTVTQTAPDNRRFVPNGPYTNTPSWVNSPERKNLGFTPGANFQSTPSLNGDNNLGTSSSSQDVIFPRVPNPSSVYHVGHSNFPSQEPSRTAISGNTQTYMQPMMTAAPQPQMQTPSSAYHGGHSNFPSQEPSRTAISGNTQTFMQPMMTAAPQPQMQTQQIQSKTAKAGNASSVLIVGAGPSGCMLAAELRRRNPDMYIAIWEAAKGTGGRAASRRFELGEGEQTHSVQLDMGTQVFSVDTTDSTACAEMESLCREGLMRPAQALAASEERVCESHWQHFWPTNTCITHVLRRYLDEAQPDDLQFNRRVTNIEPSAGKCGWRVQNAQGTVSDPHKPMYVESSELADFDAVVLTGTAWDAQQICSKQHSLNMDWLLGSVQYDKRIVLGLVFSGALQANFEKFMHGCSEIMIEDGVIHLLADQRQKGGSNSGGFIPVVVHTTRAFAEKRFVEEHAQNAQIQGNLGVLGAKTFGRKEDPDVVAVGVVLHRLAVHLQLDVTDLQRNLAAYDVIHWNQCQSMPHKVNALQQEHSNAAKILQYPGCAVVSSSPALILCGDYLTSSGFTGTLRTVRATANALTHTMRHTPKSFLIVGAGPTGCITAAKLRKAVPGARISIWECAKGCAGRFTTHRFSAEAGHAIADCGTQVLSCNMSDTAIASDVSALLQDNIIQRAQGLAWTEEREGAHGKPFVHYWAAGGTTSVLRHYLNLARPDELCFGRRVKGMTRAEGRSGWRVTAVQGDVSDPHGTWREEEHVEDQFDAVIMAIPSYEVMKMEDVHSLVDTTTYEALTSVTYDQRWAVALAFRPHLAVTLQQFFGNDPEKIVDNEVIHLIAHQGAKRLQQVPVLVVHCSRKYKADARDVAVSAVVESLAQLFNVPVQDLKNEIIEVNAIGWKQCQLLDKPLPCNEVFSAYPGCAMLSMNPPLLLGGDYLTHSNFSGVFRSALAVTNAAVRMLSPTSVPRPLAMAYDQCSILIVGAGPTGCMLAAKLRKLRPQLKITVWEAGQGAGGRMARHFSDLGDAKSILDMGSQVLTCNMADGVVKDEVQKLEDKGLLHRAFGLCMTEERLHDPAMAHYWSKDGLTSVMHHYLNEAKVDDLRFNRRVSSILPVNGTGWWSVTGVDGAAGGVSDPHASHREDSQENQVFHGVVFTCTSWDVMNVRGMQQIVNDDMKEALQSVEYDQRCSVGLVFHREFRQRLESIFQKGAEILTCSEGVIHYMAYQDVKREGSHAVVVHTTREFAQRCCSEKMDSEKRKDKILKEVLLQLAKIWKMNDNDMYEMVRASKVICWHQCQTQKPIPRYMCKDFPGCLVASSSPPLVLSGDYCTSSSFTGVVHAAWSGAQAVRQLTQAQEPTALTQAHLDATGSMEMRAKGEKSVLIIGAGMTGSIAANKVRQHMPHAHIQVWEAARGTGGRAACHRFHMEDGSVATADMGTQVISCEMEDEDISRDVSQLKNAGLIVRASALAGTEERALSAGNASYTNFWPVEGLTSVLHHYIKTGKANHVCFNRRVSSLNLQDDGRWRVEADTGHVGDPYKVDAEESIVEKFDAVIVALPAWEVIKINGINEFLPAHVKESLSHVEYDSRYSVALNFYPWFKNDLEAWFKKCAEVVMNDGVLHLIAYQGVKRENSCVVVCHTARNFRASQTGDFCQEVLQKVLDSFAAQMNISSANLRMPLRAWKVIDWRHCQLQKPLQSPDSVVPHCIVSQSAPTLVLAGDYVCQPDFSGCFSSARSAAQAIYAALEQQTFFENHPDHLNHSIVPVPRPLKAQSGFRILIVGAGPTGSMLAARLRHKFGKGIGHLAVWDAARGAAGRFSTRRYSVGYESEEIVADMGAQVLSFDNDHHSSVQEAWYLANQGVIQRAHKLCLTEEREALQSAKCTHYWARNGTSSVCRAYLHDAQPDDLRFGCYVTDIQTMNDPAYAQSGEGSRFFVSANVGSVSDPHEPHKHKVVSTLQEEFHAVVLTGTAPDILQLVGSPEKPGYYSNNRLADKAMVHQTQDGETTSQNNIKFPISQELHECLSSVRYDQRYAISMVFRPWLKSIIDAKFSETSEILVDDEVIHMIALQGAKREQTHPVLVVHTSRKVNVPGSSQRDAKEAMANLWQNLKSRITGMFKLEPSQFELGLLACNIINWRECQQLSSDSRLTSGAIVANSNPPLFLAGDFMTSPNFSGVIEAVERTAGSLARRLGLEAPSFAAARDESKYAIAHAEAAMEHGLANVQQKRNKRRQLGVLHASCDHLDENISEKHLDDHYDGMPSHKDFAIGGQGKKMGDWEKYENWDSQMGYSHRRNWEPEAEMSVADFRNTDSKYHDHINHVGQIVKSPFPSITSLSTMSSLPIKNFSSAGNRHFPEGRFDSYAAAETRHHMHHKHPLSSGAHVDIMDFSHREHQDSGLFPNGRPAHQPIFDFSPRENKGLQWMSNGIHAGPQAFSSQRSAARLEPQPMVVDPIGARGLQSWLEDKIPTPPPMTSPTAYAAGSPTYNGSHSKLTSNKVSSSWLEPDDEEKDRRHHEVETVAMDMHREQYHREQQAQMMAHVGPNSSQWGAPRTSNSSEQDLGATRYTYGPGANLTTNQQFPSTSTINAGNNSRIFPSSSSSIFQRDNLPEFGGSPRSGTMSHPITHVTNGDYDSVHVARRGNPSTTTEWDFGATRNDYGQSIFPSTSTINAGNNSRIFPSSSSIFPRDNLPEFGGSPQFGSTMPSNGPHYERNFAQARGEDGQHWTPGSNHLETQHQFRDHLENDTHHQAYGFKSSQVEYDGHLNNFNRMPIFNLRDFPSGSTNMPMMSDDRPSMYESSHRSPRPMPTWRMGVDLQDSSIGSYPGYVDSPKAPSHWHPQSLNSNTEYSSNSLHLPVYSF